ncbi:Hypothetical predicted protein, partial [Olea europaea subsp. europaea]
TVLDSTHHFIVTYEGFQPFFKSVSTCIFGTLGLSAYEKLRVTFAHDVRFGP